MTLHAADLRQFLGNALGNLAQIAERYEVEIVPERTDCYMQMSIRTRPVFFFPSCELQACSVPSLRGTRIGLVPFEVHGCSQIFDTLGVSRRVPEAMTDVEDRVDAHCAAKGFEFRSATPTREAGDAVVRLQFRKAAEP